MAPVAIHRRLSGQHVKERIVQSRTGSSTASHTCIALLVSGHGAADLDVVVDRTWALMASGGIVPVIDGPASCCRPDCVR